MLRVFFCFLAGFFLISLTYSQDNPENKNLVGGVSIADDTIPPHPSAILDIRSVSKGVIIPQMSITERDNIVNPSNGLVVFVNDSTERGGLWFFDKGQWQQLKFRKAYYPKGSIIMYSNVREGYFDNRGVGIAESTKGWHICNGNDGTPDLTNMFVVGYDPDNEDYSTFGKNADDARNEYHLGPDSIPTHKHEIEPSDPVSQSFTHTHKLETKDGNTKYKHTHTFNYLDGREGRAGHDFQRRIKSKKQKEYFFEDSGLGLEARENLTGISGDIVITYGNSGSQNPKPIDNRPAYYTLIYIMRTGPSYTAFNQIVNP
jgi:hypothetical protein